jgi:hypothetical protein
MNGYLVMLRCSIDDIPLRLFAERGDACQYADDVTPDYGERESTILRIDKSEVCNVSIYHFEHGVLESFEVVRNFTEPHYSATQSTSS